MNLCKKIELTRLFSRKKMEFLEVVPYIQTIHCSETKKPVGGEVLCRIRTPTGLVLTNKHIEAIERSDRADLYTDSLLKSILHFYLGRDASYLNNFVLSLNVRIFQINSLFLMKSIDSFLENFPTNIKVQLEIVERGMPEINEEMIDSIEHYRSKGVKVVMDDFIFDKKTIKYLEVSQLSSIKLDKEITMLFHGNLAHLKLIEALINFAKKFDLAIVAEGVESDIQADILKALGVEYLQGYLFSKPMSLSNFDSYMKDK
ncbi:EAL domain-containing protein [Klebsiella aerogenes]|uniref:EAL domain-containing protein n=1 Tax=Klebsiella aerogenes TaxID=548 RepID=UPI0028DDCD10|nr:EAL domain-containing protein [Klebsiella aerogenes]MDT8880973.1 EAL domain-containing protein [Klebsiella aerogenes]